MTDFFDYTVDLFPMVSSAIDTLYSVFIGRLPCAVLLIWESYDNMVELLNESEDT
jgi:hypothetical protein